MRKTILLVAPLGALIVVVALLIRDGREPEAPTVPIAGPLADAPAGLPHWAPAESAEPSPLDPVLEPAAPAAAVASSPPEQAPGDENEAGVAILGTLALVDQHGVERPVASGSFRLVAWERGGSTGYGTPIDVVQGNWTAEVPADRWLGAGDFLVEGQAAVLVRADGEPADDRDLRLPVPADGRLDLVVRHLAASWLVVRSEATGSELPHVEVLACSEWEHGERGHPAWGGPGCRSFPGLATPVDLGRLLLAEREPGPVTLHVRAPGHAWGRIEVDLLGGGERVAWLAAAGELEVLVQDVRAADGAVLRLWRAGDDVQRPVCAVPLERDGSLLLESVEPGRYRVNAEIGPWFRGPIVLAQADADVQAGGRAVAVLVLHPAPVLASVPMGGRLIVPTAWGKQDVLMTARLLGTPLGGQSAHISMPTREMEPVEGQPGTWAWHLPAVQPGRWELGVHRPSFSITIEVGPQGRDDLLLELPEPGRVSLRVVDADSGRPADIESVSWYPERPPGVTGGTLESVRRDPDAERFEFLAPQGEIVLHVWADGYEFVEQAIRVVPGLNEHVMQMERSCGIVLVLKDGPTTIPWDDAWEEAEFAPVVGEASARSWGWDGSNRRIGLETPGAWRVQLPRIPGYLPVPAQVVDVQPGTFATLAVELVRRP